MTLTPAVIKTYLATELYNLTVEDSSGAVVPSTQFLVFPAGVTPDYVGLSNCLATVTTDANGLTDAVPLAPGVEYQLVENGQSSVFAAFTPGMLQQFTVQAPAAAGGGFLYAAHGSFSYNVVNAGNGTLSGPTLIGWDFGASNWSSSGVTFGFSGNFLAIPLNPYPAGYNAWLVTIEGTVLVESNVAATISAGQVYAPMSGHTVVQKTLSAPVALAATTPTTIPFAVVSQVTGAFTSERNFQWAPALTPGNDIDVSAQNPTFSVLVRVEPSVAY